MHYFVIHSGSDYETVQDIIGEWGAELSHFRCSVLKSEKQDWYDDARAKIRGAEKIIYIVGESSADNPNINWELKVALGEGKQIYVYKLDEKYKLNALLESGKKKARIQAGDKDGEFVFSFNSQQVICVDDTTVADRLAEDDEYISGNIETNANNSSEVALKQYEIFVETSEELVRRKQNVNSFYISINSLLISVIIAAFTLTDSVSLFNLSISYSTVITCMLSVVGGIICGSWHSVLQSYADLNGSKMKIISYIETQLAYNLYDTEWQLVTKKMGNRRYKSFSGKEKFIAKLFFGLYVLLFIAGIGFSLAGLVK